MKTPFADHTVITIEFRCNNSCISCMIGEFKDRMHPFTLEETKSIIKNIRSSGSTSLILSGGEVTLNENLADVASHAKSLGFEHIMIQTNGRRISDNDYCRHLVDSGIDEFMITIYGPNPTIHDNITRAPGSFDETVRGIRNAAKSGAYVVTNIIITRDNYDILSDIVNMIAKIGGVKEIGFWNYLVLNKTDVNGMMVQSSKIKPHLKKALDVAIGNGFTPVIKFFPECLLGTYDTFLDNSQPHLITDKTCMKYLKTGDTDKCAYRSTCKSTRCKGMSIAYIDKFGWDEDILRPIKN